MTNKKRGMSTNNTADIIGGVSMIRGQTVLAEFETEEGKYVLFYGNILEKDGVRTERVLNPEKYNLAVNAYVEEHKNEAAGRQKDSGSQPPEQTQQQQQQKQKQPQNNNPVQNQPVEKGKQFQKQERNGLQNQPKQHEQFRPNNVPREQGQKGQKNFQQKQPQQQQGKQKPRPDKPQQAPAQAGKNQASSNHPPVQKQVNNNAQSTKPVKPERQPQATNTAAGKSDTVNHPPVQTPENNHAQVSQPVEQERPEPKENTVTGKSATVDQPQPFPLPVPAPIQNAQSSKLDETCNLEDTVEQIRQMPDAEPDEKRNRKKIPKGIIGGLIVVITAAVTVAGIFILTTFFGVQIGKSEVSVVQVSKTIEAGEKITADDLKQFTLTADQYNELTQESVINSNGDIVKNDIVLYANVNEVVGKYANETLKAGNYVYEADYSAISTGEKTITMSVDGEEVSIPVTVTQDGETKISIYAICSSKTEDGKARNVAMKLSEMSLDGKSLMDILDSDGNSIIDQLVKEQKDAEKEEESSTADPATPSETTAPAETGN